MVANRPGLRLNFLGDLEVIRDDKVLMLPPSKKTRGLLAYLALHNKALRRERLCELLWEIPDDPRGSLRWSLSKLRRLVDDDRHTRIIADRNSVSLDTADIEIDVLTLNSVAATRLCQASIAELEACAKQYRGEFLQGLELPDFSDFYTWCVTEREQAARSQAQLLTRLISMLADQPEQALSYSRQLVTLLPYEESARASLIEILLTLGRHQEAEQQYRVGVRLLNEASIEDTGLLYRTLHNSTAQPATQQPLRQEAAPKPVPAGLFGRDNELKQLQEELNTVCNQQRGRFILLRGDPGIGKSSLLEAMERMAGQQQACILHAAAFESKIIGPFALWRDALLRSPLSRATELLSGDRRSSRDHLFADLSDLVAEETHRHPVVIIFDDIQWCDESSIACLYYILRTNQQRPLLMVAAAREQELRDNPTVDQTIHSLHRDRLLLDIRLGPLSQTALQQLIAAREPQVNCQRLSRECAGNPLLALELARAENEGDSGTSLDELIRERLSRLDEDALEVLLWSAVMAPNLDVKSLERITGLNGKRLELALETAEQQGILRPGTKGFEFSHDLISQSIYRQIAPTRRQAMHRRVAELLEVETALNLQLASDLAHHAAKSGDAELATKAMISAGRLCLRFYANKEALNLAETGLQYAQQLADSERVCMTLELKEIELTATPVKDWQAAAEDYISLAEQALDYGALPFARLGYQMASYVRWIHGQWSDAQRASMQAERVTRGASEEEHITGMADTAMCLALLEKNLPQAEAMLMEASSLAARREVSRPSLLAAKGILCYFDNRLEEAEELLEEARTRSKSAGDRLAEYLANEYMVMVDIERNQFDTALNRARLLVQIGEKLREGSEGPFARALTYLCHYALSGDDQGLDQALQELRNTDAKQRLAYILNRTALLDIAFNRPEQAVIHAREALEYAELLERASDKILSHVALAQAGRLQHRAACTEHLEALRALTSTPAAVWAKTRANQLLIESE